MMGKCILQVSYAVFKKWNRHFINLLTSHPGGFTKYGIFPLCQSFSTILATVPRSGSPPYNHLHCTSTIKELQVHQCHLAVWWKSNFQKLLILMVISFILIVATIKIKGACEGLLYQTSDTLISVKKFSLFQYCILYT